MQNDPLSPQEPTADPAVTSPTPTPPTQPLPPDLNQPAQPEPAVLAPAPQPKPARKKKILTTLLVLLLLAGAAAAGYFLLLKKDKPSTTQSIVKKDIPVLTVEYNESTVPQYPLKMGGYGADSNLILQLFEGLVQFQNTTDIKPLLATSWYNPDPSTWVFTLRQGIKFHTGREMTSDDVKSTLDYAIAHQKDSKVTFFTAASTLKSIEATGRYQVKITTNSPDPLLLARLSTLPIFDPKAKLGDYDSGTGPYIVKPGTTTTDSAIDLVATDNYWGGHVYTREVKAEFVGDEDKLIKNIDDNKFDISGSFVGNELSHFKVPYTKLKVPDQGLTLLMLNTEKSGSPLQSLAFRQALEYAIDKPKLIKDSGLEGSPADQIVPISLPGHNPDISAVPYDLEKVKSLTKDVKGATDQLTLATTDASGGPEALAKQLNDAGFNIKIVLLSDFDQFVNDGFGGKYDMITFNYTSNFTDGLDILNIALTGTKNYDNSQIDSLLDQTSKTFDAKQRISLMQQIATIADKEKPIIPLYTHTRIYAITKPNIVAKADMQDFSNSAYYWKVYQK